MTAFHLLLGAPTALKDEFTPIDSEGARLIIEEAMKDDPRPLFVSNLGAVTNLASALLLEPKIAERITVIWIGGGKYPEGGFEFNQNNDINAARVVFKSKAELWQVPSNVYTTMKFSFYEMLEKVYPCGEIGKYLVENTMRFNTIIGEIMQKMASMPGADAMLGSNQSRAAAVTSFGGELWSLGDSPVIGLMMNSTMGNFHMEEAPYTLFDDGRYDLSQPGSRTVRVYDDIESRLILDDMVAKLHYNFG